MKSLIKKSMALIMAMAVLFSVLSLELTSFAATPSISVEEVEGFAGETVDVRISVKSNPGVTSVLLKIGFDNSKLELLSVTDGGLLGSAYHSDNYSNPYTLSWANDTATTNYTGNGNIVTLKFRISSAASVNQTIPVSVTYDYDNYDILDKDLNKVSFTLTDGSVKVVKKTVDVESVSVTPGMAELTVGESINLSALVLPADATNKNVTWSSSNTKVVTVDTNGKVKAIVPGSAYVTVKSVSGDCMDRCDITVIPEEKPECYGMYISSKGKTHYYIGDKLDTSSMILYIDKYGNGLYNTKVTEGFTVSGFDSSTPGKKTLTVTYKGCTDTYEIEVFKLLNIEISQKPYKTSYFVNESFDRDGLQITAYYTGDYSYVETNNFTLSGFDSSTPGTKKITVTHKGKTASFTVEIKEALPLYMTQKISGDELIVSLSIKNAKGIGSGDLELLYDDKVFTFSGLESSSYGEFNVFRDIEDDGSGIYGIEDTSYSVAVGPYKNGKRSVAYVFLSWSEAIDSDDFEICEFKFKINNLNAGKQTIKIVSKNVYMKDASVSVNLKQPEPEYILGDVNADSRITAADARLALRASVALEKFDKLQTLAADANKDKVVTAADARMILRASVGLEKLK